MTVRSRRRSSSSVARRSRAATRATSKPPNRSAARSPSWRSTTCRYDYFSTFVPRVLGLTPDDLTRAAAAHIDPDRLTAVIVGDTTAIGDKVTDLGLGAATILPSGADAFST